MKYFLIICLLVYTIIKVKEKKLSTTHFLVAMYSYILIIVMFLTYDYINSIHFMLKHTETNHLTVSNLKDEYILVSRPTTTSSTATYVYNDDGFVDSFEEMMSKVSFERINDESFRYQNYTMREGYEVNIHLYRNGHYSYHFEIYPIYGESHNDVVGYDYYIYDNNDYGLERIIYELVDYFGLGRTIDPSDNREYTLSEEDGKLLIDYINSIQKDFIVETG